MISRDKFYNVILVLIILAMAFALVITLTENENMEAQLAAGEPEIVTGNYTLFHYTDAGWINPIYVTRYSLDGQVLRYVENGTELPISFEHIRIVPGWVEGDELMQYGFWVPEEFE